MQLTRVESGHPSSAVTPRLNGSGLIGITPNRVVDTRVGTGVTGKVGAGQAVTLTIPGLPAGTTAVMLNVTATNPTTTSFLTVYPAGTARPRASNLTFTMISVAVGTDAKITLCNNAGTVNVIADLTGRFGGKLPLGNCAASDANTVAAESDSRPIVFAGLVF